MSASQDVSRFRSQRRSQGRTISKLIPAGPQISVNSAVNKQTGIVQTDYESEENLTCKVAPLINDWLVMNGLIVPTMRRSLVSQIM